MNGFSRNKNFWVRILSFALVIAVSGMACNGAEETAEEGAETTADEPTAEATPEAAGEGGEEAADEKFPADHILVQHVLIGFQGSVPGKNITRTQEEAATLANEVLKRAKSGEDFGELVREYTDDRYPGVYSLANNDVTPTGSNESARSEMVPGFGDTAFSLRTGEVGMAVFGKPASPFGWHIIKRVD